MSAERAVPLVPAPHGVVGGCDLGADFLRVFGARRRVMDLVAELHEAARSCESPVVAGELRAWADHVEVLRHRAR